MSYVFGATNNSNLKKDFGPFEPKDKLEMVLQDKDTRKSVTGVTGKFNLETDYYEVTIDKDATLTNEEYRKYDMQIVAKMGDHQEVFEFELFLIKVEIKKDENFKESIPY